MCWFRCGAAAPPGSERVLRLLTRVRPWSFVEVFMLGTLVALVRLAKFAHVVPGIALWCCALLMLSLSALTSDHPARTVVALGAARARQ
jgi:paraquat-inducible protein A